MSAPAALEPAARAADYETFLQVLDTIPTGVYFSIEDMRDAVDSMQLQPNAVGALFCRAYEDGWLTATDRIVNCKRSSRRGGTARVWRKAAAR